MRIALPLKSDCMTWILKEEIQFAREEKHAETEKEERDGSVEPG